MAKTTARQYASRMAVDPQPAPFTCPHCGHGFSAAAGEEVVTCPGCGAPIAIGVEGSSRGGPDEAGQPVEPADDSNDAELSAQRIHQISAMRRGAYRTRSWLIIAAVVCVAGAAQLIYLAIRDYRLGHRLVPLGDVIAAAAALIAFPYFARRAARVNREIRQSLLDEPPSPPDFSTLSDGSQRWKNLEAMTEDQTES